MITSTWNTYWVVKSRLFMKRNTVNVLHGEYGWREWVGRTIDTHPIILFGSMMLRRKWVYLINWIRLGPPSLVRTMKLCLFSICGFREKSNQFLYWCRYLCGIWSRSVLRMMHQCMYVRSYGWSFRARDVGSRCCQDNVEPSVSFSRLLELDSILFKTGMRLFAVNFVLYEWKFK